LYYSTAYIDGQKVTAQNETLVRLSTFSPRQRRTDRNVCANAVGECEEHEAFCGGAEEVVLQGMEE
jgi:hypothetical protein